MTAVVSQPFNALSTTNLPPDVLYWCRVLNSTNFQIRVFISFRTVTDSGTELEQVTRYLAPGEVCDFGERPTNNISPISIHRHITRIRVDDGFETKRSTDIDIPGCSWPNKNFCEFEVYEDANMKLQIRKLTSPEETLSLPLASAALASLPALAGGIVSQIPLPTVTPTATTTWSPDVLYWARVHNSTNFNVRVFVNFQTFTDHPTLGVLGSASESEQVTYTLAPGASYDFGERSSPNISPSSIRRHVTSIWADDGFETKRRTDVDIPGCSWPNKNFCEFQVYEDANMNLRIRKLEGAS